MNPPPRPAFVAEATLVTYAASFAEVVATKAEP